MSENPTPYTQGAAVFQLLAHPSRLHILDELRRGPACVCHLQAVLERPQAYISQQLRLLREADVVLDEKDGLNVYYRIVDARVEHLRLLSQSPAVNRRATTQRPVNGAEKPDKSGVAL